MVKFEVGIVLNTGQWVAGLAQARWVELREMALRAEALGFDAVWTPDELLWLPKDKPPIGFWEGVAMAGAVAAATSRIKVGTWVMSALHRNAGITAKVAETLDEISGGRFVFGLGSGHAGSQAHAFGLPEDKVFARFEEALEVIIPLLREGRADVEGTWHAAHGLLQLPQGPRPGRIPIMLGVHGPKGQRLAARYADIWSCYAEEKSDMSELGPRLATLEAACAEAGRDPATIGRSAGVMVSPLESEPDPTGEQITGSSEKIADAIRTFRDGGFTQVELLPTPTTVKAVEALAPVLELLRVDEN
ncbi:MAG: LLM class flavin-dependent oxidoreductase [Chloroflexota bacterium]|nr:MAG: LLM class flavin-dependent oxidoreductase [Chloroflexota bacterium]